MSPEQQLFEIARRRFDTPGFRGMEFIEVEARSVLNHVPGDAMPFSWTINPYRGCSHACVYCFARPTHTFLEMDTGRDFESKIVVKVNAPEVLRRELAAKRWKGEHVAMGTAIVELPTSLALRTVDVRALHGVAVASCLVPASIGDAWHGLDPRSPLRSAGV